MFLIWGTKHSKKRAGLAGCFCVVCRTVTAWKVIHVRQVAHLYYLPLGPGTHVWDELTCEECRMERRGAPGELVPCKEPHSDPVVLASETNLDAGAAVSARLDLESRLLGGAVTPGQREVLIAEVFVALDYLHELRSEKGAQRSILSLVTFLFLILGFITAMMGVASVQPGFRAPTAFYPALALMTAVTILLFAFVVQRSLTNRRRAAERYVTPLLVRSLGPIQPTREELESVIRRLRAQPLRLAKAIDPERVHNQLALASPVDGLESHRRAA